MEIPGYKWDPQKKRYFKVLSTGQLPGGNYTVSALAETERSNRRNTVRKRAEELANESPIVGLPETVFEFKKLGRSSKEVYVGGSDELISSIHVTAHHKLATGSRNGVIAYNGRKSDPGRSIIGITDINETLVAAAVDHNFGSTVATPHASVQLPHEYVTSICSVGDVVAIGSQSGIGIWNISNSEDTWDNWPLYSVSALTSMRGQVVLSGTKSGAIEIVDLREASTSKVAQFENRRAVTNIGVLSGEMSIVATGLEDQMWMYDLRNTRVPAHQFAGYENWSMSKHGFSMNQKNTAIAVAIDDGRIRVYDGTTGNPLGVLSPSGGVRGTEPPPISSLAWNSEGLFIAHNNSVRLRPGHGTSNHTETRRNSEGAVAKVHNGLNSQFIVY